MSGGFPKGNRCANYVRNFEITVRRKDGTLLTAAASCFCHAQFGREHRALPGIHLDITEKKRSEDEMRRRNRELNALNATGRDCDAVIRSGRNSEPHAPPGDFVVRRGNRVGIPGDRGRWHFPAARWLGTRSEARVRMSEASFAEGFGDLVMRSRAEVVTQDFVPHLPPAVVEFCVC